MKHLLITFSNRNYILSTLKDILSCYKLFSNKIYVFENLDDKRELIFSYNILKDYTVKKLLKNTISVHRKKDSNTLYTINALNTLIMEMNNGILNKSYQINWNHYENMILLTTNGELYKINIELFDIVDINKFQVS